MFRNFDLGEFAGFILALVGAVVLVVFLGMLMQSLTGFPPPADSPFPSSANHVLHDCISINLTAVDGKDGIDSDGTLHCLYNAGYSLAYHGDPIIATPSTP